VTIRDPRCQVVITVKMAAAISSGSHPPSAILVRFAAKNTSSVPAKTAPMRASFQAAQFQSVRATIRNRAVVISSVPVTATP
jgi:hypothetical protein